MGAIDRKHVAIKKYHNSRSVYYNYEIFFSIVMTAVVNTNYEFIMVDVGSVGEYVFNYTKFSRALSDNTIRIGILEFLQLPNSQKTLPLVAILENDDMMF